MTMILRWASGTPSSRVTLSPIVICSFSAGTRKTHVNASSAPGPVPGGPAAARIPRASSASVQSVMAMITTNAVVRMI